MPNDFISKDKNPSHISELQLFQVVVCVAVPQKVQLFVETCSLSLQPLSQLVYFPEFNNNASFIAAVQQYVIWLHFIKKCDPE